MVIINSYFDICVKFTLSTFNFQINDFQIHNFQIQDLHQYQSRACILAGGIKREEENEDQITEKVKNVLTRNLGFNEEEVQQELDKCHRTGPVKDSLQTTIVRFKSAQKEKQEKTKKIKAKLSLTRTSTKTLNHAHEVTNENPEIINLPFADPNGNLKFRLKKSINRKSVFLFRNIDEINKMIIDYGW